MSVLELLMLSAGLSMDAFAAAVCKGLSTNKLKGSRCLIVGAWFGCFQAIMPLVGYFAASLFSKYIMRFGGIFSFVILLAIGVNMIREAFSDGSSAGSGISPKEMFPLALATSADAFAAGVTMSFKEGSIAVNVIIIGCITCILSAIGVKVGNVFGKRHSVKAQAAGGAVLILLAFKLFLDGIALN